MPTENKRTTRTKRPASQRRSEIHPLDRSIQALREQLAKNPDDVTLYGRMGALYYRRGDMQEAEKCYRKALSLAPNRPSLHNNLGNILCDMGRLEEGIGCYEHALELEKQARPDVPPSEAALTNLELAKLEFRLVQERITYYERALEMEVGSSEAHNAAGNGYLLCNQRRRALEHYRQALKLNPRDAHAARNLAFVLALEANSTHMNGDDLPALLSEIAECGLRFPREARLYIHQGELLESAGLFDEAEQKYIRAIRANPRHLESYELLGRLRELTGTAGMKDEGWLAAETGWTFLERSNEMEPELAKDSAQRFLDVALSEIAKSRFLKTPLTAPIEVDALLREAGRRAKETNEPEVGAKAVCLRAQLLESNGQREEAEKVLEEACELFPRMERIWFERAVLAMRAGDITRAVEGFERATLANPQESYLFQTLRFSFEGYRRYRTEKVRFESALKANANDAMAYHHFGLAALSVMKDEEALFHFGRALELDPKLVEAACGKARALRRRGQKKECEVAYRQALTIDPNCREALNALNIHPTPIPQWTK